MKNNIIFLVFIFICIQFPKFAQSANLKNITLEWDEIPGATKYEIEIVQTSNSRSKVYSVNQTKWIGKLERGSYNYRIRALDSREVAGPWSEFESLLLRLPAPKLMLPEDRREILSEKANEIEVNFKWLPILEAHHYRLEVEPKCPNQEKGSKFSQDTQASEFSLKLPSACKYEWQVIAYIDEKNEGSKVKSSRNFSIIGGATDKVQIQEPKTPSEAKISWSPIVGAKYGVSLFQLGGGDKWNKFDQKELLTAEYELPPKLPQGVYQIAVVAQAPMHKVSQPAQIIFEHGDNSSLSTSDSILGSVDLNILKPQSKTIIANYSIAQLQMKGSYNNSSTSSSSFLGSRFSIEGIFTTQKEKLDYYSSFSVLVFKTDGKFGNPIDLRGGVQYSTNEKLKWLGGIFYKETPQRYFPSYQAELTQVGYLGANIGGQYLFSQSDKWSYSALANLDLNLIPLSTPNGKKGDGDRGGGIKLGVLASRFYKNKYMIYGSFLIANDSAKYGMSDQYSSAGGSEGSNFAELNTQTLSIGTSFRF